ncbi:putative reverse transcriptase domain-containing protein [Tanacetum coccineum]
MTTAGTRAVVNTGNVDHFMLKEVEYGYPKGISMTSWLGSLRDTKISYFCGRANPEILFAWNMQCGYWVALAICWQQAYLFNYEEYNGGFVAFGRIKREFSVARTPQQNGVAERKNRTLIEAARTMLADSLLPIPFMPESEPFGALDHFNTLRSLGKFDGKSDEGYLLGYSTSSKAFRVYNKRTKRVEENHHINFLEDQPNVSGTGTQDSYVAGSSGKDKGPTQECILLLLQPHRIRILVEDVAPAANEKPSKSSPKDNDV